MKRTPRASWPIALSCLACCAGMPTQTNAADAPEGLLYLARFNDYPAASWARGSRVPANASVPQRLTDGKFGQALALDSGSVFSIVGNDGNFSLSQGTVEMWVRPNWNGDDDDHARGLITVPGGPKSYLNVNKIAGRGLGAATGSAGVGLYRRIDADVSHWRAGEWHHVAVAWGGGSLALFVDGKIVDRVDESTPPERAPRSITLGAQLDGAIDELAIWSMPKESFDLASPIVAPELPRPEQLKSGLPRITELDRYHFSLPDSESGAVVATKHFDDEVDPSLAPARSSAPPALSTFATPGEYRSVGFVVYATADLEKIRIEPSPLRSVGPDSIGPANVAVFLNRRVLQRKAPRVSKDAVVPVAGLLDTHFPFDLPAGHFKEATVTVKVPDDAVPGEYRGNVAVRAERGLVATLPFSLRVLPFRLRRPERKQFGMYYQMDLSAGARERVEAELRDIREHGVNSLYLWQSIRYKREGNEIVASYDALDKCLALMRGAGFTGTAVVNTGFIQLARLLGLKQAGQHGADQAFEDERFTAIAVRTLEGLAPLKRKYRELRLVVTHMDEVMGRERMPLYISLTRPVLRVPGQLMYITLHNLPRPWVRESTKKLDPFVNVRGYNGHALDLAIQGGRPFEMLARELKESGDEGWVYYNPNRPFFVAKWARIVNGLFMWWSPLKVHCPYRYRTIHGGDEPYSHNMAFSMISPYDLKTPIATRQWEGYRLGAQDVWYLCMLEDLVAEARERQLPPVREAEKWLAHLRGLMPNADEIQGIENQSPLVFKVAERLDAASLEKIRLTTAEHIMGILGVE